jgi:hypothetical protein
MRHGPITQPFCQNLTLSRNLLKAHTSLAQVISLSKSDQNPAIPASAATVCHQSKSSQKTDILITDFPRHIRAATPPHNSIIVPISSHYKYSAATPDNIPPFPASSFCQFRPATPDNTLQFPASSALTKIPASGIITKNKRMWRNLADAQASGACGVKPVEVRLLSSAVNPLPVRNIPARGGLFCNSEVFNLGGVSGR